MNAHSPLIVAARRTPIGALSGSLAQATAPELGALCLKRVLEDARLTADTLDEVILGNVVAAGIGQNPARQAAIKADIPVQVGATTINKVCGSGLKAVMLAAAGIRAGDVQMVLAGGMESMTRAPYLLPKARQGFRLGHGEILDATIHDGLWDAYAGKMMGVYGDLCANHCGFDRQQQDDFAVRSYTRARKAAAEGIFKEEIVPVEFPSKTGTVTVTADEEPERFDEAKLRKLRPAFGEAGTVTAGNASSINDGAAAVLVASEAACEQHGLRPLARIVGYSTHSREPEWFSLAPIGAIARLLQKLNWQASDVDLYEINEAFSAVTMAAQKDLRLPDDKVNILGGAVALGHPIGASGARVLVTLLTALRHTGGKRGVASLCIGGGEAVALAVEIQG